MTASALRSLARQVQTRRCGPIVPPYNPDVIVTPEGQALGDIARRYGIALVLQFGSSVTGKTHARSDIDLAIQREGAPLSFREHAELVHELQALFPNHEVDLALLNRAAVEDLPEYLRHVLEYLERLPRAEEGTSVSKPRWVKSFGAGRALWSSALRHQSPRPLPAAR